MAEKSTYDEVVYIATQGISLSLIGATPEQVFIRPHDSGSVRVEIGSYTLLAQHAYFDVYKRSLEIVPLASVAQDLAAAYYETQHRNKRIRFIKVERSDVEVMVSYTATKQRRHSDE